MAMRLGVALPQTAIGTDPSVVRDFAQAAEAIGFDHLSTYDHVVGANVANRPDWKAPYTVATPFHDPFVLFGYLSGLTRSIEFTTQILILPQRQAVLVAKQAASLDRLCGGRLRLGIGIGWNPLEFVALGERFEDRGVRSEEQVAVMKALWTEEAVTFKGTWHDIPDVGINPRPVQRPIPLWFGGHVDRTFDRIARMGDGWITLQYQPDESGRAAIDRLRGMARVAGRADDAVGVDAWVSVGAGTPDDWRAEVQAWRSLGVSHVTMNTTFARFHHVPLAERSFDAHVDAARRWYAAVQDLR